MCADVPLRNYSLTRRGGDEVIRRCYNIVSRVTLSRTVCYALCSTDTCTESSSFVVQLSQFRWIVSEVVRHKKIVRSFTPAPKKIVRLQAVQNCYSLCHLPVNLINTCVSRLIEVMGLGVGKGALSPQKILKFLLQNDTFWCILNDNFNFHHLLAFVLSCLTRWSDSWESSE